MIKRTSHKNYIRFGLGMMALFMSQAYAIRPVIPVSIQHLAFSNDSTKILYISNQSPASSSIINFIDAQTGETTGSTQLAVKKRILGFTPDGFKTAVLEPKGLSILHNKTGTVLRTLKAPPLSRPDIYAARSAITNKSGTAQLFHSEDRRALHVIHTGNGNFLAEIKLPKGKLHSIGISQNGRTVAYVLDTPATTSQLHLFDTYQKKMTKSLDLKKDEANSSYLNTISFSPNEKYLSIKNSLIDLNTNRISVTNTFGVSQAVFTPNERFLLVPMVRGQLLRYDLRSKQKHVINLGLPIGCRANQAADISPNEKFIAYGSVCHGAKNRKFISILSAVDGSLVRKLVLKP